MRRGKQGFAADIGEQMRAAAELVRERLLGAAMLDSGLFDSAALGRLVEEHAARRADHSQALWQLLVFEGFLARHAGAVQPAPDSARALASAAP